MEIKVLGPGCSRCSQLEKEVINTLAEMDLDANVEKVQDIQQIMNYKIMSTPALVINGQVKAAGRVPKREEIKNWLKENK